MALGALAAAALSPAVAEAGVNCARAGAVLSIDLTAPGDAAHLSLSGQNIQLRDKNFSAVACANGPTVLNVDTIDVDDGSIGNTTFDVDDAHAYAPGASDAGNDAGALTNEIEFDVNLGTGGGDTLRLATDSNGGKIVWGSLGINPNAGASEQGPDADITTSGVEVNQASGSFGAQTLSGAGGEGAGAVFTRPLELDGGFGNDLIEGGSGNDELGGSFDDDIVKGGAGDDDLQGSFNADDVSGGPGIDTANFRISCAADENDCSVKVNLADDGFVDGGSVDESDITPGKRDDVGSDVENITGGADDDTLIGSGVRNVLDGRLGRDRLLGLGGRDLLLAQDFVQDLGLNCGKGKRDRVLRDRFDPRGKGCELPRRKRRKR